MDYYSSPVSSPTNYSPGSSIQTPGSQPYGYSSPNTYQSPTLSPGTSPIQGTTVSSPFGPTSYQQQQDQTINPPQPTPQRQERAAVAVTYICGHCATLNPIKPTDIPRCRECGYRIMYKQRTTRSKYYIDDDINFRID